MSSHRSDCVPFPLPPSRLHGTAKVRGRALAHCSCPPKLSSADGAEKCVGTLSVPRAIKSIHLLANPIQAHAFKTLHRAISTRIVPE
jgi:hypothetical protein